MPWTAIVIRYDSTLLSDNILLVSKALISEIGFVHLLNVMQIVQRAEFSKSEYANKLCFSSRFILLPFAKCCLWVFIILFHLVGKASLCQLLF